MNSDAISELGELLDTIGRETFSHSVQLMLRETNAREDIPYQERAVSIAIECAVIRGAYMAVIREMLKCLPADSKKLTLMHVMDAEFKSMDIMMRNVKELLDEEASEEGTGGEDGGEGGGEVRVPPEGNDGKGDVGDSRAGGTPPAA